VPVREQARRLPLQAQVQAAGQRAPAFSPPGQGLLSFQLLSLTTSLVWPGFQGQPYRRPWAAWPQQVQRALQVLQVLRVLPAQVRRLPVQAPFQPVPRLLLHRFGRE